MPRRFGREEACLALRTLVEDAVGEQPQRTRRDEARAGFAKLAAACQRFHPGVAFAQVGGGDIFDHRGMRGAGRALADIGIGPFPPRFHDRLDVREQFERERAAEQRVQLYPAIFLEERDFFVGHLTNLIEAGGNDLRGVIHLIVHPDTGVAPCISNIRPVD
jgi:hypothetical protein